MAAAEHSFSLEGSPAQIIGTDWDPERFQGLTGGNSLELTDVTGSTESNSSQRFSIEAHRKLVHYAIDFVRN
jgi:hypothetical protein